MREDKTTKWKNGNLKTRISYQKDGRTKAWEYSFWKSGRLKEFIAYQSDGVRIAEVRRYPDRIGGKIEWRK